MEVSQFELVYKPQSPAGPADTVLQGYFLEISNLEKVQLEFALRFTTSSISDVDRDLFDNAVIFVDTPGVDNNSGVFTLVGGAGSKSYGLNRRIVVPAHGTALVAVLPSDPFPPASVPGPAADFECRGYVTISLPAVFKPTTGGFVFGPQAKEPQKVLLSAQNRATYTDPGTGEVKGQTQGGLPLASGQALNEIEPSSGILFPGGKLDLDLVADINVPDIRFQDMLASMLATASNSDMDLSAFNEALRDAGVGIAVENRKVDATPKAKSKAKSKPVPAE